jgi:putative hydrolase of the HAD superfamily
VKKIKVLLLDIGGVLLTNGWGHEQRQQVLTHFGLDAKEFNPRHEQNFDTFELGKLSLDDYLYRTVFYEKRSFTPEEFKTSMFAQSQPLDGALAYFKQLKQKHNFRVIALMNTG